MHNCASRHNLVSTHAHKQQHRNKQDFAFSQPHCCRMLVKPWPLIASIFVFRVTLCAIPYAAISQDSCICTYESRRKQTSPDSSHLLRYNLLRPEPTAKPPTEPLLRQSPISVLQILVVTAGAQIVVLFARTAKRRRTHIPSLVLIKSHPSRALSCSSTTPLTAATSQDIPDGPINKMPAGCLTQVICGLCNCCASTLPPFPALFLPRYSNCVSMRQSAIVLQSQYNCPVTNRPSISEVQVTF